MRATTPAAARYACAAAEMDEEMSSADVQAKREAALSAGYVNADSCVDMTWRYLLLSSRPPRASRRR
jgi:hypothetical protein